MMLNIIDLMMIYIVIFLSIDIQYIYVYIYIYMSCIYYNGFDFIYVVILDIQ